MHWGSSNRSLSRYSTDGRGSAVCQCRDEQRQQETSTRSLPTMPSSSDLSNRGAAFHVSRGGSCSSSKGRLISRPLHTCRVELGGAAADTHRRRETKLTPKRWGGNQTDGLRFAGRVFLWVPRSTSEYLGVLQTGCQETVGTRVTALKRREHWCESRVSNDFIYIQKLKNPQF